MRFRNGFLLSFIGGGVMLLAAGQNAITPDAPVDSKTIIRAEKKLVLVDTVVTDKKGDYVHDLTQKDFRVWEDKKEQNIESFSFEADPASPASKQKHYLILFFDNASMQLTDQMQARRAAAQFIDKNAGPDRYMAVVNFTGSLQIAQNFTNDADRLRAVVGGTRFSTVSPNGDLASLSPQLGRAAADFGARDVLLSLRSLAKNLAPVPGRKTLIFLSAGFPLDLELRSELTAVIDVCNKSNIAIYPIDVRGLVAENRVPAFAPGNGARLPNSRGSLQAAYFEPVSFAPQHGGGAGGAGAGAAGGGGRPGGGAPSGGATGGGGRGGTTSSGGSGGRSGTTSGTTGGTGKTGSTSGGRSGGGGAPTTTPFGMNNPYNQPRVIVPHIPDVSRQQEVLYTLAEGTGGFVIVNTNDLVGGLQRIANELNEYYVLGYSPSEESKEGACHELKVKVDRGGIKVRARTGYCTAKPLDFLAGSAEERELENHAASASSGNVNASMEVPFFYTSANTARVNVAMEIPSGGLKFTKEKGKLHAVVNVLGIATEPDGAVAARFSDALKLDLDNKKEVQAFEEHPIHYQTQFDIASGKYNLKVVFSSAGEGFGKIETPLEIDTYSEKNFSLSGVALSDEIHPVSDLDVGLDAALLEDKTPLVSQGMQLMPSGSNMFKKAAPAAVYVEIYEPLLEGQSSPKVGLKMRIVDKKSGAQKLDTGFINVASYAKNGNAVIPVGLRLPVDTLTPGAYRVELQAIDTANHQSPVRAADFAVQ